MTNKHGGSSAGGGGVVIDLTEYLTLKRGLEVQGRLLDKDAQAQLNQRIIRIRESIARIDRLMQELKGHESLGPHVKQGK